MTMPTQTGSNVGELPEGYQAIPEADRKKAQVFADRARTVGDTGNYDYAIEMYMQALAIDPDSVPTHQSLRELSLKRKVSGGKDLGFVGKMKLKAPSKDEKQNLLNSTRLLAYDPGNTDVMLGLMKNAHKAGFYDTAMWIGDLLFKAIEDSGKPDFSKYLAMREIYISLKRWKKAVEACQLAISIKPDEMDLQRELKNLSARLTMDAGNYETGGSFRDSIKDMDAQRKLLDEDRNVTTEDVMGRLIEDAEKQYQADPTEPGKLMKLVETLIKTESTPHENRAIELLQEWYDRTRQFRFRQNIGQVRIRQIKRAERALKLELDANPNDPELLKRMTEFQRNRVEQELAEYQLWAENYPTESKYKFEVGKRLFILGRFDEAIPMFQQVRMDPKYRVEAGTFLGQAFLKADFVDEAVDTLNAVKEEHQIKGDERAKEIYYWYARSLEAHQDAQAALKAFSQVAQWDFNYRDVQQRIKALRAAAKQQ